MLNYGDSNPSVLPQSEAYESDMHSILENESISNFQSNLLGDEDMFWRGLFARRRAQEFQRDLIAVERISLEGRELNLRISSEALEDLISSHHTVVEMEHLLFELVDETLADWERHLEAAARQRERAEASAKKRKIKMVQCIIFAIALRAWATWRLMVQQCATMRRRVHRSNMLRNRRLQTTAVHIWRKVRRKMTAKKKQSAFRENA